MKIINSYSKLLMFLMDVCIISISAVVANILLTNKEIIFSATNLVTIKNSVLIAIAVYEIYFIFLKVYKHITRFENGKDYFVYIFACLLAGITLAATRFILKIDINSVRKQILGAFITSIGIVGLRIAIRFFMSLLMQERDSGDGKRYNVLIIGAGYAGRDIIKSIKQTMNEKYNIVGIIDDDKSKLNCSINGVDVIGNRNQIVNICNKKEIDEIFFAISKIDKKKKKEILEICQETGKKIRILPTTEDIIRNKNMYQNLREVDIEDILGRDPVKLDNKKIVTLIEGKTR